MVICFQMTEGVIFPHVFALQCFGRAQMTTNDAISSEWLKDVQFEQGMDFIKMYAYVVG